MVLPFDLGAPPYILTDMAILKIARMGHPVLLGKAAPVADPGTPEIRRLVSDMIETMADARGTGLAAPQVHVPLRVMVFFVSEQRAGNGADEAAVPLTVLINPEIEPVGDAVDTGWEGCLSIPGMTGAVPRWHRIRYRGVTPEGETVEREAAGFHARVVQHEFDHLEGVLYPMRMTDLSQFAFVEELSRAAADAQTENTEAEEAAE